MINKTGMLFLFFALSIMGVKGQTPIDSSLLKKEYSNIDEALKTPENVFRLNLSNQKINFSDTIWAKFPNLQYLS